MKPDIDFSKATAEHYKIDNPDMRVIQTTGKQVPEIYSLADAKAVFFSLREDETPVTDSCVGIGRSTCMCPKSPEELFSSVHLSATGRRFASQKKNLSNPPEPTITT